MSIDYKTSVFADYSDELAMRIIADIKEMMAELDGEPDDVKNSIAAAALLTAAQVCDGNEMPKDSRVFKPFGIADVLAAIIKRSKP